MNMMSLLQLGALLVNYRQSLMMFALVYHHDMHIAGKGLWDRHFLNVVHVVRDSLRGVLRVCKLVTVNNIITADFCFNMSLQLTGL